MPGDVPATAWFRFRFRNAGWTGNRHCGQAAHFGIFQQRTFRRRRGLGGAYWASLALVAGLLMYLHLFRRSASLDSLNRDFFLANIAVSICVMLGIGASVFF